MKPRFMGLALALFSVLFIASTVTAAPLEISGRLAIVDLDVIAKTLGRDKVIANAVNRFIKIQEDAINNERDKLKTDLALEKKKIGKKPNANDQAAYNRMASKAESTLHDYLARAERGAAQLRARLVTEFRDEVQPTAVKVAGMKGFSVVFIRQPGMLYVDPRVDISNDVAKVMATESSEKK